MRITRHERTSRLRSVPLIVAAATVSLVALFVMRMLRPTPAAKPDPAGDADIGSPTPRPSLTRAPTPTPARESIPRARTPRKIARAAVRRRREARDTGNRTENQGAEGTGQDGHSEIDARDYIAALRAGGETEGLAAFPPPGTRSPRAGVIVPDDYVLPEGFARHYQATDDGEQLAPILIVAPGYELVDDAGETIPLADNRIVPPDFAPPDLPLRILEVPSGQDRQPGDH